MKLKKRLLVEVTDISMLKSIPFKVQEADDGSCCVDFPTIFDLGEIVGSLAEADRIFAIIGQQASQISANNKLGIRGDKRVLDAMKEIERFAAEGRDYIAATGLPL